MVSKKEKDVETNDATASVQKTEVDLDSILINELGQFGAFQLRTVAKLAVLVIFIGWGATEYIFTTARIRTRCLIPECEDRDNLEFSPEWILNAVPGAGDSFDGCQRFANNTFSLYDDTCPSEQFDLDMVVPCEEFVYENENTIVYDFDLGCDEWRRTFVGSLRTIGVLLALPIAGYISDRWGRRTTIAIVSFNTAVLGSLRYFANTYIGFLMSVLIEAILGTGGYSNIYVLVLEMVGTKYRVAAAAMLSTSFAIGQGALALLAWAVPYWRHLTLAVYVPQVYTILYLWIVPESIRWLLCKGRYDDAKKVLDDAARINKKKISEESFLALKQTAMKEVKRQELMKEERTKEPWLAVLVFQHKPILLRCVVVPLWWIANTLIYYGLTINSVNISSNRYLSFMAVSLVEIPGFWTGAFLINFIGRKPTLIGAFTVCAGCQLAYLLLSSEYTGAVLAVYLIGKWAIANVVIALYVYSSELCPTKYRLRMFSFFSMIGRIGSIVAPLTPAFGEQVPFILFGSAALVAALLCLLTPETRGVKLPDTMEEAANTGRKPNKLTNTCAS